MRFYLVALAGVAVAGAMAQQPEAAKELENRVEAYLKLRKEAAAHVPKLKDKAEPEEILAHKRAVADAIRAARPRARQGDVLTPPVQAYLKGAIRSEMTGKLGRPAKETAKLGNPEAEGTMNVPVKVNAAYPESASLSSVPPRLLMRLPELPKEVEFRFVGRHLILRDVSAGIIVDFVPNAMPRG